MNLKAKIPNCKKSKSKFRKPEYSKSKNENIPNPRFQKPKNREKCRTFYLILKKKKNGRIEQKLPPQAKKSHHFRKCVKICNFVPRYQFDT